MAKTDSARWAYVTSETPTFIHPFVFNAIHLKFCNNIELTIPKKMYVFLFFRFRHFWRENHVTKFPPNFVFIIMGHLMMISERSHRRDVKSEKKIEICPSTQKI